MTSDSRETLDIRHTTYTARALLKPERNISFRKKRKTKNLMYMCFSINISSCLLQKNISPLSPPFPLAQTMCEAKERFNYTSSHKLYTEAYTKEQKPQLRLLDDHSG